MADVIIVGGGAAGMAAAIAAAECGDRVTVLERMDRVGKKLLATGNGRCNLMNAGRPVYPGGQAFAEAVLARCGAKEQERFWHAHGLWTRVEDGGRVYPVSSQASTVLDVLRLAMQRTGVQVRTGMEVSAIRKAARKWQVLTAEGILTADRVIVTGGGRAQSKLGSNGSCYSLMTALGHRLVDPRPSLTQIETDTDPIRGLSGIRVRCKATLYRRTKLLHSQCGEALFADYGVSGVCVMQCARWAMPGDTLSLDLIHGFGMDQVQLRDELLQRRSTWLNVPMEQLLTGLVVPRLGACVMRAAQIMFRDRTADSLTEREAEALCEVMTSFRLRVKAIKGYEQAQVTAGGIACDDFDPQTMESRLAKGLHAAGEVLDVDGDCGGFNLMFAFGSGILAGLNGRSIPYLSTEWEDKP